MVRRPLQRWLAFTSLFFFLRRAVRAGDHHLLVKGSGDDIGTVASIVSLIEPLRVSRASQSSSVVVRRLGAGWLSRRLVRCLTNSSQLVARKLCDERGALRTRDMSSVDRMGRWSVRGPRRPGSVSHFTISSVVWVEHQTLSGLVQLPVE